jgi:hypothetical protein
MREERLRMYNQEFLLDSVRALRACAEIQLEIHTSFAISLSLNFCTFPVLVFGSSVKTMVRGHL